MPLAALGLLLVAAIMHAIWNLVLKQAKYKQLFIWWALSVGSTCFLVFLFINKPLPLRIWPYALSSACMEALYYAALTWAYDSDDFSLTYPLARGTAPALLALWTALFLNEQPRPGGLLGLALLIAGLIVVGSGVAWSRLGRMIFSAKGIVAALAAALCISIYSAIDGAAVRIAAPSSYTVLTLGLSALLFAPVVLLRYGRSVVLNEWRVNFRRIIFVGIIMLATYILVLQAYSIARVSYAGAIREVSIVFATLAGWFWLGERFGLVRTVGSLLIFAGIIVIAVLG